MIKIRPIKRFVILQDDQPEITEGGIVLSTELGTNHLDYYVVAIGTEENAVFSVGDRVILSDPNTGRKIRIDGVQCRVVRVSDIIAIVD